MTQPERSGGAPPAPGSGAPRAQRVVLARFRRVRHLQLAVAALVTGAVAIGAWAMVARSQAPAPQTAAPEHTNHLAGETSPYLLQHAHNPVDWYPWGPEAFEKAKKEGKPIFLSIGYSSCHWCHVMERESFEDEGIAHLLNENFVAIKVDREERPDIDEIYMTAVQMMTGSGGWPMSSFLTPEGKPFFGGTYFPRDAFAELLQKVHAAWTNPEQRTKLVEQADRVSQAIGQTAAQAPQAGSVSPTLVSAAVRSYLAEFDPRDGGFGGPPKFPPSMRLALMLAEHRRKPDPKLLHAVTFTLDRMARGGIYDQVGGGFHRYSTDAKWLVPHFEKMLYDNALLSWIYLQAYRDTDNPFYRCIATETLDFVLRELRDPKGGFWSTLDADSEGQEGKFYVWSPEEVIAVLGQKDGKLFNRIYGITPEGNFEGRSIPNRIARPVEARARELKITPGALWARLDAMRTKLLAARAKRVRPPLDDKVLTSWNGLMLRSLALGYDLTGEARYRQAAEAAAGFLLSASRQDGRLRHSYRQGKTQPNAFLEDYSFLIVGLLELHRATGEARWLKEAQALTQVMVADFWDEQGGTFFSTPQHHEALLARLKNAEDGATPSGQSMAALALVRLSRLTQDRELRVKAQRLLNSSAGMMKRFPAATPDMLLAADTYFRPSDGAPAAALKKGPVAVTVVGAPSSARPGQTFEVAVRFLIQPGWHINAEKPTDPLLIPTRVTPAPGPYRLLAATYPPAQTVRLGFRRDPLKVYTSSAVVRLRLKALPGAGYPRDPASLGARRVGAGSALRLRVRYQACNDRVCQSPTETLLVAANSSRPR